MRPEVNRNTVLALLLVARDQGAITDTEYTLGYNAVWELAPAEQEYTTTSRPARSVPATATPPVSTRASS